MCAADLFAVVTIAIDASSRDVVVHLLGTPALVNALARAQLTALLFGAVRANDRATARDLIRAGADATRVLEDAPMILPRMRALLETMEASSAMSRAPNIIERVFGSAKPKTVLDILKAASPTDFAALNEPKTRALLASAAIGRTLIVFAAPWPTPLDVKERTFVVLNAGPLAPESAPETYTGPPSEKLAYRLDKLGVLYSIVYAGDGVYSITKLDPAASAFAKGSTLTRKVPRKSAGKFKTEGVSVAASDGYVLIADVPRANEASS